MDLFKVLNLAMANKMVLSVAIAVVPGTVGLSSRELESLMFLTTLLGSGLYDLDCEVSFVYFFMFRLHSTIIIFIIID